MLHLRDKDVLSGLLFAAIGLFCLFQSIDLDFGSTQRPGPGFFPVSLSVVLMVLGAGIIARSLFTHVDRAPHIVLRPLFFITAAVIVFAFCIERLGLLPSVFIAVIVASFAKAGYGHLARLSTAAALAIFAAALFVGLLGLPIPIMNF